MSGSRGQPGPWLFGGGGGFFQDPSFPFHAIMGESMESMMRLMLHPDHFGARQASPRSGFGASSALRCRPDSSAYRRGCGAPGGGSKAESPQHYAAAAAALLLAAAAQQHGARDTHRG